MKIFTIALENCKTSVLKHYTEKPILLNFENKSTLFWEIKNIF